MIGIDLTGECVPRTAGFVLGFVLIATSLGGATIDATGGWGLSIGREDLAGGAGSDFPEHFESRSDASVIAVGDTGGSNWSVSVRRSGAGWPEDVRVYVRRTSSGTFEEDQTISGGVAYREVSMTEEILFEGSGDGSGVDLQYRLGGASVGTSAGLYDATIHLEITEGNQ